MKICSCLVEGLSAYLSQSTSVFVTPLLFVVCLFVSMLLCFQAPISAVITMETVPSCAYPPPQPPEPACVQQDTACAEASSLVRVGHICSHFVLLIEQKKKILKKPMKKVFQITTFLLQVLALSCCTLYMRAFVVFLWTH